MTKTIEELVEASRAETSLNSQIVFNNLSKPVSKMESCDNKAYLELVSSELNLIDKISKLPVIAE